ncbi:MAG: hypothetical protein RQ826_14085, partial [Xanthomonadales bacterium]|nr:hypothetical protein [Xanthomonadales bacterium]
KPRIGSKLLDSRLRGNDGTSGRTNLPWGQVIEAFPSSAIEQLFDTVRYRYSANASYGGDGQVPHGFGLVPQTLTGNFFYTSLYK